MAETYEGCGVRPRWQKRAEAAEAALQALHAAEPSRAENARLRRRVAELEAALREIENHAHAAGWRDIARGALRGEDEPGEGEARDG